MSAPKLKRSAEFEWHTQCPFCGAQHDLASTVSVKGGSAPERPSDGDLTLCIVCGEWALFEKKAPGGMRKPTDAEYEKIAASPMVRAARAAWLKVRRR